MSYTKDQELRLEVQKNLTPKTKKIIIAHLLAHQVVGHARSPEGFGVTWEISANNSCVGPQKVNSIILAQEAGAKAWAASLLGDDNEANSILETYIDTSLAEALGVTISVIRTYKASRDIVDEFPEHPRQWAERIRNPHGLRLIH